MTDTCVLIPYFEAQQDLLRSLASIDEDVDVIVVDDGSVRAPAREALGLWRGELSVRLLELAHNMGIEYALNEGLAFARGRYEYIARLDCGDRVRSGRFAIQREFLNQHPLCMMVGTWVDFTDTEGNHLYTLRPPLASDEIRHRMAINCAFHHPSVMFRAAVFDHVGGYPEHAPAAEDFALFCEIARRFETANLPQILTECPISPASISTRHRRQQIRSRIKVLRQHFAWSPLRIYGLLRALALYATPRSFTVRLNRLISLLPIGETGGRGRASTRSR